MLNPTESREHFLSMIGDLAVELPPGVLTAVTQALGAGTCHGLERWAVTSSIREKLRYLEEQVLVQPGASPSAVALALEAAALASVRAQSKMHSELAWTGPATEAVPLRRVDQVIYELLETASEHILLVTYAAYRAARAVKALQRATERGVQVDLVLELAQESGGKISFDGLQAFRRAVPEARVLYWPLDRRLMSSAGAYGSMHAKCIVVDRARALVTSANLTDYALEANMELGVVMGTQAAGRLAEHFEQLIARGDLVPAPKQ